MKVREVRVEYGRTVNLGNYESERLSVGLMTTVEDGEDFAFLVAELYERVRQQVVGRLERQPAYRTADEPEGA